MSPVPEPEPTQAAAANARGAQLHVALTSFFALFATVGLGYYGLSFFYDFMVRDYGWTRGQVTSGNAVGKLLVGPVFGFVAGWVIDRFGPRRLMLAGLALGGVALAGLGTVSTLPFFYLFFVCNALSYVCGGPLPNQVLLSRWFDRARGKAMGFAYLGIGIGGAIAPRLAHALTEGLGWNQALRALGVLFVLLALPLALFVRDSPQTWRGETREEPAPVGPLLRTPAFYLLAIGSMCSIGAVGGTMLNLKLFLALDRKLPQVEVAWVLSLVLTFSIAGRLLMGWCADRFAKKRVMIFIYLLVTAGLPILLTSTSTWQLVLFAAVFGIGLGGDYMIIPLMAAELFGVRVLGRVMGLILTADGAAEAVVPWIVAQIRDQSGSYAAGFGVLIALAGLGAVAVSLLPGRAAER